MTNAKNSDTDRLHSILNGIEDGTIKGLTSEQEDAIRTTLANTTNAANVPKHSFELTLHGFHGRDDLTDDFVLWVMAPDEDTVRRAAPAGTIVIPLDIDTESQTGDDAIDFVLPGDKEALKKEAFKRIAAHVSTPMIEIAEEAAAAIENMLLAYSKDMPTSDVRSREAIVEGLKSEIEEERTLRTKIILHNVQLNDKDLPPTGDDYNDVLGYLGY